MRKIVLFMAFAFAQLSIAQTSCIVTIPDANFKNALLSHTPAIDTNGDGEIQCDEASTYTGNLNLDSKYISNLTGIEAFTAITQLNCSGNSLTSLDVSSNTSLKTLFCSYNPLTSLNLSSNMALESLHCSNVGLTSLDVSANTALTHLNCGSNNLTSLNVSTNVALQELHCSNNQLTTLDVGNNAVLIKLDCNSNELTTLDVNINIALVELHCSNNQLTNLDVSTNTALMGLYCSENQLTNLDVSTNAGANTALFDLQCHNNQLTSLDVSTNTALQWLFCDENQLTSLNIANGNNSIMQGVNALNNPNLTCIQVDNANYSNTNWTDLDFFNKPAGASWSENCALSTSDFETFKIAVYPNPTNGIINLSEMANVTVFDMQGRKIAESKNTASFDLSSQTLGIYLAKITTEKASETIKIVKQ